MDLIVSTSDKYLSFYLLLDLKGKVRLLPYRDRERERERERDRETERQREHFKRYLMQH